MKKLTHIINSRGLIFLILVPILLSAKPTFRYGLATGSHSWGITVNTVFSKTETSMWMLDTRFYDVKGENEFVLQNNFGNSISLNEQSLVILPIFGGMRKTIFQGKIENNFIPFIEAGLGAVLVGDGDESIDKWFDRWKRAKGYIEPGAYAGVGVKFWFSNQTNIVVRIGLDYLPLRQEIDNRSDYNQAVIQFLFSR